MSGRHIGGVAKGTLQLIMLVWVIQEADTKTELKVHGFYLGNVCDRKKLGEVVEKAGRVVGL